MLHYIKEGRDNMKKFVAISLTAVMLLCFTGSVAFAATTTSPIQEKTKTLHKISVKNNKVKTKKKTITKSKTNAKTKTASKAKAKTTSITATKN
jgi:hypothetical protein